MPIPYSPTRTKFNLNFEIKPMLSLRPKIEIGYRQSEYKIIDRLDKEWKIKTRLNYIFSRKTNLFLMRSSRKITQTQIDTPIHENYSYWVLNILFGNLESSYR